MPRYATDRELLIARRSMGEDVIVPPAPKKRKNEESLMQQAVINWWAYACKGYGIPEHMLFSVPNGGRRDPKAMVFLKREGLRNGVCDLFLSVPRGEFHGLYIELKTATGRVSEGQENFMGDAGALGYAVAVCRSAEEAIALIGGYVDVATKPANTKMSHAEERK
jgi:hypothetical protein